jgi:hypothetical protein
MNMRLILATGSLFCLGVFSIHATGQDRGREEKAAPQVADKSAASSTNDQIEVKTNRFSNVTTITLKPQAFLNKPEHLITVEIETRLGEKDMDKEIIIAFVRLELQSKSPMFPGGAELNFLVNGQPLSAGKADFQLDGLADINGTLKPGFRFREYSNSLAFNRRALEQFSKADRIEMQLGSIETALSSTLVATLREYATQALAQHKIATERKQ